MQPMDPFYLQKFFVTAACYKSNVKSTVSDSKCFSQFCALWITKWLGCWTGSRRLVLRPFRRTLKCFGTYKVVCLFAHCKHTCFLCSMLSKNWTSEMPPAESGELLNRKPSCCLSWSTPILSPTRSHGREGTVCYTSSWASVKEVICTESLRSRKGSFCLRVR